MELSAKYDPSQVEDKWYAYWLKNKFFHSEPDEREPYTIVIPPPNVTGILHMGHVLNNTLNDVLVRKARMDGKNACWIPGTDHASIATESKVVARLKSQGINKEDLTREEFLKYAWEWKEEHGGIILSQLRKLGASCDWDRTKFTMDPDLTESVINTFVYFYKKGLIYRGVRMVNWDPEGHTAVSDEEVVHKETKSHFYHLRYYISDGNGNRTDKYIIVATTRPETIMADAAVSINPDDERYHWLKGKKVLIPLINKEIPVIEDSYVEIGFGTGCLKVTPAHDVNDYEIGLRHNLPVIDIIDDHGKLNEKAQILVGEDRFVARKKIQKMLEEAGCLEKVEEYVSPVGYSERTNAVIEPRLSTQWFLKMGHLAEMALDSVESGRVKLIPDKYRNTYKHWMETVRDWCISRQLWWGHQIPAFYCDDCGKWIITPETMKKVEEIVEKEGTDAWWAHSAEELLPEGFKCPHCGGTHFHKEKDIMDVWFDSGSTWNGVLRYPHEESWKDMSYPCDLYLEGSDQHRGWFHSSLLTSVAVNGHAPYKAVLTHGFTMDGEGRKMSKSVGNVVAPQDVINKYGADVMRLWISSVDYQGDVRLSDKIVKSMSDVYRKIRNTFRYLLGNLSDFDPKTDSVAYADMEELDRWALLRMEQVKETVLKAYDDYEFHVMYHAVHNFCTVDLSAIYLDILKDRLYTEKADSKLRRSAQTAMYEILTTLVRLVAPVLCFTSEEVWQALPNKEEREWSVHMSDMPKVNEAYLDKALDEKWKKRLAVRSVAMKALEEARQAKVIGHPLDAEVTVYADGEAYDIVKAMEKELADFLLVSQTHIVEGTAAAPENAASNEEGTVKASVAVCTLAKCERCWKRSADVDSDPKHPGVCARCAHVLIEMGE